MGGAVNHRPDSPVGCGYSWGKHLFPSGRGLLSDMQEHICNHNYHHAGDHECKCGGKPGPAEYEAVL